MEINMLEKVKAFIKKLKDSGWTALLAIVLTVLFIFMGKWFLGGIALGFAIKANLDKLTEYWDMYVGSKF